MTEQGKIKLLVVGPHGQETWMGNGEMIIINRCHQKHLRGNERVGKNIHNSQGPIRQ